MRLIYFFVLFLLSFSVSGQIINGHVYDANNNLIYAANVLFQDVANTTLIKEFTPVKIDIKDSINKKSVVISEDEIKKYLVKKLKDTKEIENF